MQSTFKIKKSAPRVSKIPGAQKVLEGNCSLRPKERRMLLRY